MKTTTSRYSWSGLLSGGRKLAAAVMTVTSATFLFFSTQLAAQDCPEITSATLTDSLCLGGRLEFNAQAAGGAGKCTLKLELKPIGADDSAFKFIASIANGPGKTLNGYSTLSPANFPAGDYEARFSYDCDADNCPPTEKRIDVKIFPDVQDIVAAEVTPALCEGGAFDFYALALCGEGDCTLKLEVKPKAAPDAEFKFIGSVADGPGKILSGSMTLVPALFPVGLYEARYTYSCSGAVTVEKRLDFEITPEPFIENAAVTPAICAGEAFKYEATGVGGAGDCGFTIQIKPATAPDNAFVDLATAPGKSVMDNITLPAGDYPAGDYVVRFIYGCAETDAAPIRSGSL